MPLRRVIPVQGSKAYIAHWIFDCLNIGTEYPFAYVEPFCGSCAMYLFLYKKFGAPEYVVLNDKNEHLINAYRQISYNVDGLKLELKKYERTRDSFLYCRENFKIEHDDCKRAAMYITAQYLSSNGKLSGYGGASMVADILFKMKYEGRLNEIARAFYPCCLSNKDAMDTINQHKDYPDTLIYLDPPYLMENRTCKVYSDELTDGYHETMLDAILTARCKVAISGFDSQLYNRKLKSWRKYTRLTVSTSTNLYPSSQRVQGKKEECLWVNRRVL